MGFFGDIVDDFTGKTAEKAAEQQAQSIREGQNTLRDAFGTTEAQISPFAQAGGVARNRLLSLLGLDGGDGVQFEGTPGFDFALDQGLQARERAASAGGFTGGGRAQKEAIRFGTGIAQQDRGNEINRLLGLSSQGQTAATNLGSLRSNNANALANLSVGRGDALASGLISGANSRVGTINNLSTLVGDVAGAFATGGGSTVAKKQDRIL